MLVAPGLPEKTRTNTGKKKQKTTEQKKHGKNGTKREKKTEKTNGNKNIILYYGGELLIFPGIGRTCGGFFNSTRALYYSGTVR